MGGYLSLRKLCQKSYVRVEPEKYEASDTTDCGNRVTVNDSNSVNIQNVSFEKKHVLSDGGCAMLENAELGSKTNDNAIREHISSSHLAFHLRVAANETSVNEVFHGAISNQYTRNGARAITLFTETRNKLISDDTCKEQASNTNYCSSDHDEDRPCDGQVLNMDEEVKESEKCSGSTPKMEPVIEVQLDETRSLNVKHECDCAAGPESFARVSIEVEDIDVHAESTEACSSPTIERERGKMIDQDQSSSAHASINSSAVASACVSDCVVVGTPPRANERSISFLEPNSCIERSENGHERHYGSLTQISANCPSEISPGISVSDNKVTFTHLRNKKMVSFLESEDHVEHYVGSNTALESSLEGCEKSVSFLEHFQSKDMGTVVLKDHNVLHRKLISSEASTGGVLISRSHADANPPLESFCQMQSIADIARNHYQQVAKSCTNMKHIVDLEKINVRRNSQSMPSLLSKRKARLSVLVESDEKRSSSVRDLPLAAAPLRSCQGSSVGAICKSDEARHDNLSGAKNVCHDSAMACQLSAMTESSFFDPNKMRRLDITNDDDWISVSDDENDDSIPTSFSLRIKPPKIKVPARHNFGRKGSYSCTNSGTLWVDGFGKAITNRGIKLGQSTLDNIAMRDRLVFLCKLGEGASGTVFKALDLCSLKLVAVKIISFADRRKRRQIVSELGNLHSLLRNSLAVTSTGVKLNGKDCIVELIDAFSDANDESVGICFEYMDGGSLEDIVEKGGCANESILSGIAYQCLLGIGLLHQNNQVHRDIKPANILISTRGEVKIGDLGISRHMTVDELELSKTQNSSKSSIETTEDNLNGSAHSQNIAAASSFVGTLTYMSPERINGQEYTYSADIWSLGLSILATALGRLPIDNHGFWSVMNCVNGANPLSLPPEDDRWSVEFRDFLNICLQKDPKSRPSCEDLLRHKFVAAGSVRFISEQSVHAGAESNRDLDCILVTVNAHIHDLVSRKVPLVNQYIAKNLSHGSIASKLLLESPMGLYSLASQLNISLDEIFMRCNQFIRDIDD